MLRPDNDHIRAIKGLIGSSPSFFKAYVEYLEKARAHEHFEMEASISADTEVCKGRCRILTEQINILRGLLPKE